MKNEFERSTEYFKGDFYLIKPVSIKEILEKSKEKIIFNSNTHKFGELDMVFNLDEECYFNDIISGKFKYIGMIDRKTNRASGLGRLVKPNQI